MKVPALIPVLLLSLATAPLYAKKTQSQRTKALSPAEQQKTFKLPEGYVIELVASEKDGVINPIDMAFDDAGRLWTQTARMYPLDPGKDIGWNQLVKLMADPQEQKKNPELYQEFQRIRGLYQGKIEGEDKILILSNLYGEGGIKTSVFADGLTIPQSVLPYRSGAYVAQGSEMFFLDDTDGDGMADKRTPILTGFGYTDSHTMSHTLVRGPGNWIHFSQGALNMGEVTALKSGAKARFDYSKIGRFSIDGEKVEVIGSGLNNIWGFWMRANGQWWGTEANDFGMSIVPMEPGTGYQGIGNQRIRPYQPWMPILHKFRVGGTGISGLAYSDDQGAGFPREWENVALLANPITSTINSVHIVRNEDGSVSAKHLPDFLSCEDDWFRPVNIEFGPDGCLYIADWYNKIVSHNEVPRTHPDRDKSHGRIWRVRHTGADKRKVPDLTKAGAAELVKSLCSPFAWEKRAAMQQIVEREIRSAMNSIVNLLADESAHTHTRIHALWALEGLGHYEAKLMQSLLGNKDGDIRREAVRAMIKLAPDLTIFNAAMAAAIEDPNPMVRSAALRAIAERAEADAGTIDVLVSASKPEFPGSNMGGPYERRFERYLARMALEQFASKLSAYLGSELAAKQSASNLLWASQALPQKERDASFSKIWKHKDPAKAMDEATFVILAKALGNPEAAKIGKPLLAHLGNGPAYVRFAIKNQSQVQSPQLAELLSPVLTSMLGNPRDKMVSLDAIARLKAPVAFDTMLPLLKDKDPKVVTATLKAMQANPKANLPAIEGVAKDASVDLGTRLSASHSLLQIDGQKGHAQLDALLGSLADDEKKRLVQEFSGSKAGADLMLARFNSKAIALTAFDLSSAQRIHQFNRRSKEAGQLLNQIKASEAKAKQEMAKRLAHLMKVTDSLRGNAESGKAFFNSCLMCHKVGERGHDIAPALDGSAHREKEALLTAIIDPDAAVESGYQVFRVRKKDNTTLEGYRASDDETGVTLAFMGGTTVFIAAKEIASKGFVSGRSFMPSGLINGYSDQQVADLLAYIATLK